MGIDRREEGPPSVALKLVVPRNNCRASNGADLSNEDDGSASKSRSKNGRNSEIKCWQNK